MRRGLVIGVGVASLLAGCKDSGPEQGESLLLTVNHATPAYDPAEAGSKGSGDLGQSETSLQVGDIVLADCVEHNPDDVSGLADAVRVKDGPYAGQTIPLIFSRPSDENPQATAYLLPIFDLSADQIREQLEYC